MQNNPPTLDEILKEANAFMLNFQTLLLSTCDSDSQPEASYAPFVRDTEGNFYVYISQLAKHTGNLANNPKLSVLFIENETEAGHLFARRRLSFVCEAGLISRDSEHWQQIITQFSEKFGDIMNMLRDLKDFQLFQIRPAHGNYVRGFAQAYRIDGEQIRHRNEQGHQSA